VGNGPLVERPRERPGDLDLSGHPAPRELSLERLNAVLLGLRARVAPAPAGGSVWRGKARWPLRR
jgi:hypothetical protein